MLHRWITRVRKALDAYASRDCPMVAMSASEWLARNGG